MSPNRFRLYPLLPALLAVLVSSPILSQGECFDWQAQNPDWIFCDDFESPSPLVGPGRYFEHDDNSGEFSNLPGVGVGGTFGMRARWQQGEVNAGNLKLAFGRNPSGYMNTGIRPTEDFREVYYRMFLRMEPGWMGNPNKLSRATTIAANDWSQAMIAHLWEGSGDHLGIDPVRCVSGSNAICQGYNDFPNMTWLGAQSGVTPIFQTDQSGQWFCIESHVRLNDSGQSNGVQEFWIDGQLEARGENLDFVASYTGYAINAIFFENYTNAGSPQVQERYFDRIVVSVSRIGCGEIFEDGFESGDLGAWSGAQP